MILGEYSPALYAQVAFATGILSIILCEVIAVKLGHEPPFPHAYITATASHYPEYVIFRIGTISGSVFTILAHFANYFWIKSVAYESVFQISKYYPKISLIFGIMGGMFLFVSTAAIDTGRTFDHLHNWCAASFFVFTILSCLYNTFINFILFSNTKIISKASFYIKVALTVAFIVQIAIGSKSGCFEHLGTYMENSSDLSHILEYTLAFTILGNILAMGYDLKGFKFVYDSKT